MTRMHQYPVHQGSACASIPILKGMYLHELSMNDAGQDKGMDLILMVIIKLYHALQQAGNLSLLRGLEVRSGDHHGKEPDPPRIDNSRVLHQDPIDVLNKSDRQSPFIGLENLKRFSTIYRFIIIFRRGSRGYLFILDDQVCLSQGKSITLDSVRIVGEPYQEVKLFFFSYRKRHFFNAFIEYFLKVINDLQFRGVQIAFIVDIIFLQPQCLQALCDLFSRGFFLSEFYAQFLPSLRSQPEGLTQVIEGLLPRLNRVDVGHTYVLSTFYLNISHLWTIDDLSSWIIAD